MSTKRSHILKQTCRIRIKESWINFQIFVKHVQKLLAIQCENSRKPNYKKMSRVEILKQVPYRILSVSWRYSSRWIIESCLIIYWLYVNYVLLSLKEKNYFRQATEDTQIWKKKKNCFVMSAFCLTALESESLFRWHGTCCLYLAFFLWLVTNILCEMFSKIKFHLFFLYWSFLSYIPVVAAPACVFRFFVITIANFLNGSSILLRYLLCKTLI